MKSENEETKEPTQNKFISVIGEESEKFKRISQFCRPRVIVTESLWNSEIIK